MTTHADRLADAFARVIAQVTMQTFKPDDRFRRLIAKGTEELAAYRSAQSGEVDGNVAFPANDWFPCEVNFPHKWGPWLRHDGSGTFGKGPKHIRVSLGSSGQSDAVIYLGNRRSGWGRNHSPDWSDISFYRMGMDHPHYLELAKQSLEMLPSRNTSPQSVGHDELVERLHWLRHHCFEAMNERNGKPYFKSEREHAIITAAITAISSKPAQDWVKIEDIPDEWKDGRDLDVTHKTLGLSLIHI